MNKNLWIALAASAVVGLAHTPAQAGHYCGGPRWSIGIGIGVPVYRPYYAYPYGYPYPYAYPYYYPPPPPPVVVQQPVIQQVPVAPAPQAPQQVPPPPPQAYQAPAPRQVDAHATPTSLTSPAVNIDHHLQQLTSTDERTRADSVLQLGRAKDARAIDPLAATLSGDRSPMVRETAARALGLIGSPAALPALQHAAQVDADHDVRRSAQFAAEVIQSK